MQPTARLATGLPGAAGPARGGGSIPQGCGQRSSRDEVRALGIDRQGGSEVGVDYGGVGGDLGGCS
jgi:hypothetical protein